MDFRFYLTYNGVKTEIGEPVGWDSIETSFKREKTHGVVFDVTTSTMGFYGIAKQIIINGLSIDGYNANILFGVDWRCVNNSYTNFYSGRVSLTNGFDSSNDTINCIVEQLDEVVLFNNRIDQKIDVLSDKSIGDITIDKAKTIVVRINGQQLKAVTSGKVDAEGWTYEDILSVASDSQVSYGDGTSSRHGYIFPLLTPVSSDLGTISSSCGYTQDADSEYSAVTFNVIKKLFDNENIKIVGMNANIGELEYVKWSYRLKGRIIGNYTSAAGSYIKVFHGVNLQNYQEVGPAASPSISDLPILASDVVDFSNGVEFDISRSYNLIPNDNVPPSVRLSIKYFMMNDFSGKLNIEFDNESFVDFSCITALSNAEGICFTSTNAIYALDALKSIVSIITDNKIKLASELDEGSIISNLAVTSGKHIRNGSNSDGTIPAIQTSFKDLYNSLDSLACLGMGIKNGALRVENWLYFYQKSLNPLELGDINSIKRTVDNERLISNIKVGYSKYSSEGQSGSEDCFADRDYSTFLETTKNSKDIVSRIIASGYMIEECRRISAAPNTSIGKYDEDLFFLDTKVDDERTVNLYFIQGIECQNGDKLITISDTFEGIDYPYSELLEFDSSAEYITRKLCEEFGIKTSQTTSSQILKANKQRGYYFTGFYSAELSDTNQLEYCIWLWSLKNRAFKRIPVFRANLSNNRWERVYSDYIGGYLVASEYISDDNISLYGTSGICPNGVFFIPLQLTNSSYTNTPYNYLLHNLEIASNTEKQGTIAFFDNLNNKGMSIPTSVVSAANYTVSVLQTAQAESYSGASGKTLINAQITPHSNLKRWAQYLSIPKLGNKKYPRIATFTGGTANYMATVNGIEENSNIELSGTEEVDLESIPSPYVDTFDAPLSKEQYEIIKSNPYASIRYDNMEGWIKECRYQLSEGEATLSVYPSLATFGNLYQENCKKIEIIKPEEKTDTDIAFIDRFEKWQNGMPYGWEKMTDNGSQMYQIESGVLISGGTYNFDTYKRIIALPSNTYSICLELVIPIAADPFDGLSLIVGTRLSDQKKIYKVLPEVFQCQFSYTGEINHIKLQFMAGRNNKYVAKVKSITIKTV